MSVRLISDIVKTLVAIGLVIIAVAIIIMIHHGMDAIAKAIIYMTDRRLK